MSAIGEENGERREKKMTANGIASQMGGEELKGGRVPTSGQSGIIVSGQTSGKGWNAIPIRIPQFVMISLESNQNPKHLKTTHYGND